jgi:hydroxymethylbilane synthase
MSRRIVVATRKSALALAQTRALIAEFRRLHPAVEVEELHVTTTGDRVQDRALNEIGGKGLFIKEIEEALLDRRADFAVHSMKDVPAELAPSLVIGCVPRREDPEDVVVTRDGRRLAELDPGSKVGTSSLRRSVQLRAAMPALGIVPLRGNVDTRLRRVREGAIDAAVLARAGLKRLGLLDHVTETLDPEFCIPAAGQGALAIEHRAGDVEIGEFLLPLADADTTIAVAVERGVLSAVEGSCQIPVAAYARRAGAELDLQALLAEPDGSNVRRRRARGPWPVDEAAARRMGIEVGDQLRGS